jgi:hypothetical protein
MRARVQLKDFKLVPSVDGLWRKSLVINKDTRVEIRQ